MRGKNNTYRKLECKRERARSLFSTSYTDLLINSAAFLVIAAVFLFQKKHPGLLVWIAFNLVVLVYRFGITYLFRRMKALPPVKVDTYVTLFWSGVLFFGLVFGSAGFLLFPQGTLFQQVFLAIILWGISATSIGYYAPSLGVSVTYLLLVTLPVTLSFFVSSIGQQLHTILGILGIVYFLLQCVFSIKMNRYFTDNLDLQMDNKELTKEFVHEVKSRMTTEKTDKDCHSH